MVQNPATVSQQLSRLRDTQKKVSRRIQEIRDQLSKIENDLPPADQYESKITTCMSGQLRIWCVQYVRSSRPKLRDQLMQELAGLSSQMQSLRLREQNLARRAQQRRQADQRSREFDKKLEETLREAEKRGSLDEGELADLLEGSESVLMKYVNILRANPSVKNIDAVLRHLETPALLGADTTTGKSADAFQVLRQASETLAQHAQRDFDKVPSVGNFDRLLSRTVLRAQLGGAAWTPPAGLRRVGKRHTVAPGETLSGIANQYYGSPKYWTVIYMENFTNLDPKKLQPGMVLTIP